VAAFYGEVAQGDLESAMQHLALAGLPAGEALTAKGKVRIIASEMHDRIKLNGGLSGVEILDRQQHDREHASVRAKLRFRNGQVRTQTHRLVRQDADWKIELRR